MWLSKNHKQDHKNKQTTFLSNFNQHLVPLLQVYNKKQFNLLQASSSFGHFVWKLYSILYAVIFFSL